MAKLVSKVYGDALMQAARGKDKLDAVFEEAVALKIGRASCRDRV